MMAAPLSLFGTVPITILRESGQPAPDWTTTLRYKTFQFPGGNQSYTQVFGLSDLTIEYQVRLESEADFQRLLGMLGTRQTLRVPLTATAFVATRTLQEHGELYKEFDRVFLTGVTEVRLRRNGTVVCLCAMSREVPL